MDNKPKKSKALIITIIILLVLLLAGYLIYQNRDSFGVKTSATITKLFSPLVPSQNSGTLKVIAQAGEDLNKGDNVSVFGTGTDNNPIVVKTTNGSNIYGTANENIRSGNSGEILTTKKSGNNNFWSSIKTFVGNVLKKDQITPVSPVDPVNPVTPKYECVKDGIVIDCRLLPPNPPVYECTKDGIVIDCRTIGPTPPNPLNPIKYECKKDGIVIDCRALPPNPIKYECKKDGIVVDCRTINPQEKYPSVVVTATPASVAKGGTSTIKWTSTDAKECILSGGGITGTGIENTIGVTTGTLTTSTSYNVICTGENGLKGSDNAFVAVEGSKIPDLVVSKVTPRTAIINTPATLSSTIRNIGNAPTTGFSGYFSINSVDDNYTKLFTAINIRPLAINGNEVVTIPFTFRATGTYSISVCADKSSATDTGKITEANENNNCSDLINFEVTTAPTPSLYPKITLLKATPSYIKVGELSKIEWASENTNDCKVGNKEEGIGTGGFFSTGALSVTTSYTITCTGLNADQWTKRGVTVFVGATIPNVCTNSASNYPACDNFCKITDFSSNKIGSQYSLSWDTTGCQDAEISPELGQENLSGSNVPISPTKTTLYTLKAYSDSDRMNLGDTETIEVEVGGLPDLTTNYLSPTVATINKPITISSVILNKGGTSTEKEFSSFFSIIKEGAPTLAGPGETAPINIATLRTTVPLLNAGISSVAKISYTFSEAGAYQIRACADKSNESDTGTITESNENNNCGNWTTFTVNPEALPPLPPNVCAGGETNYPACDSFCKITDFTSLKNNNIYSLSWSTSGCGSANISPGVGDVYTEGSGFGIYPTGTTTYTLKAYSDSDRKNLGDTKTVLVNFNEVNQCSLIAENPLVFTDAERAILDQLLRKFYIIAPTLKTTEDIAMIYKEMDNYKNMIAGVTDLTNQCYAQTKDRDGKLAKVKDNDGNLVDYTGPIQRSGNPWYKYGTRVSYIPNSSTQTTNYCAGKFTWKMKGYNPGKVCEDYSTETSCTSFYVDQSKSDWGFLGYDGMIRTGCTWVGEASLKDYEKILNIW